MRYRRQLASCLLAFLSILPSSHATAAPGAHVATGTMSFDCWGCDGPTHGTLDGSLLGVPSGSIHGDFTASFPGGLTCSITASASGTITGAINANFTLTYVFPGTFVMTFSTSGNIWVGTMVAAGVDCGIAKAFTFVTVGAGVSW